MADFNDFHMSHSHSFRSIFFRKKTSFPPCIPKCRYQRQNTADRLDLTIQSQFSDKYRIFQNVWISYSICCQHSHSHWQIKGSAVFANICRRQIDGNFSGSKREAGVFQSCSYSFFCLFYF